MSVNVLWIKQDGRRMIISFRFPGKATCKDHEKCQGKVTCIGLLLSKITGDTIKVDTRDVKELEHILQDFRGQAI